MVGPTDKALNYKHLEPVTDNYLGSYNRNPASRQAMPDSDLYERLILECMD